MLTIVDVPLQPSADVSVTLDTKKTNNKPSTSSDCWNWFDKAVLTKGEKGKQVRCWQVTAVGVCEVSALHKAV
jgi:hypothetical protein